MRRYNRTWTIWMIPKCLPSRTYIFIKTTLTNITNTTRLSITTSTSCLRIITRVIITILSSIHCSSSTWYTTRSPWSISVRTCCWTSLSITTGTSCLRIITRIIITILSSIHCSSSTWYTTRSPWSISVRSWGRTSLSITTSRLCS